LSLNSDTLALDEYQVGDQVAQKICKAMGYAGIKEGLNGQFCPF
jgi:hypothetical protein